MPIKEDELISSIPTAEDRVLDNALRPRQLSDYIGQEQVVNQLRICIQAALQRVEPIDHVLLWGPPGLGKTTLARIIAHEVNSTIATTSGPVLDKGRDIAALLSNLERRDVLFIDEIHRLAPPVEEILYPAMEDYKIDIMLGDGAASRPLRLDVAPFTLVGATTRSGLLTSPLRDRFGISLRMDFYDSDDLAKIVTRSAELLDIDIDEAGAYEIAKRSRGTPRIANRLLRRVRDYAQVGAQVDAQPMSQPGTKTEAQSKTKAGAKNKSKGNNAISGEYKINHAIAQAALQLLGVDENGLDEMDRKLLSTLMEKFSGGPVGISNIAASLQEEKDTLEDVIEPYLIQQGFIKRTPRGRMATELAYRKMELTMPANFVKQQEELF